MRTTISQYAQAFHEIAQDTSVSESHRIAELLFAFLKRKRDDKKLSRIIQKMQVLQDRKDGVVRVSATTAFTVQNELKKEIETFAQELFASDSVILEMHTDAKLLGGVVLRTENQMIDTSVAETMKRVRNVLTK